MLSDRSAFEVDGDACVLRWRCIVRWLCVHVAIVTYAFWMVTNVCVMLAMQCSMVFHALCEESAVFHVDVTAGLRMLLGFAASVSLQHSMTFEALFGGIALVL